MDLVSILIHIALGAGYSVVGDQFAQAVKTRFQAHGVRFTRLMYWVFLLIWPIPVLHWILTCVVTQERRPSPLSRRRDLERLASRKAEIETARDWENRITYWQAESQRAKAESNQNLEWLAEANLSFLLDSQPMGAQTPEERAKDRADRDAVDQARANAKTPHQDALKRRRELERSKTYQKRSVPSLYSEPRVTNADDHSVDFCNNCHRYRKRDEMMMKGMCRECSTEQGLG